MFSLVRTVAFAALLVPGLAACHGGGRARSAASAAQPAYVSRYPATLRAELGELRSRSEEARGLVAGIPRTTEGLKSPPWDVVRDVVRSADEAGRSDTYVERAREGEGVRGFFDAEKDELGRRLVGAAQFAGKKQGCGGDIGGGLPGVLRDSVDKQLDKRGREVGPVGPLTDRLRVQLGREGFALLEKQAEALARASFLVFVDLPERAERVERMVGDAEVSSASAEAFALAEQKLQADHRLTMADKKASGDRAAQMTKARAAILAAAEEAKPQRDATAEELRKLEAAYTEAYRALERSLDEHVEAAAAAATANAKPR